MLSAPASLIGKYNVVRGPVLGDNNVKLVGNSTKDMSATNYELEFCALTSIAIRMLSKGALNVKTDDLLAIGLYILQGEFK